MTTSSDKNIARVRPGNYRAEAARQMTLCRAVASAIATATAAATSALPLALLWAASCVVPEKRALGRQREIEYRKWSTAAISSRVRGRTHCAAQRGERSQLTATGREKIPAMVRRRRRAAVRRKFTKAAGADARAGYCIDGRHRRRRLGALLRAAKKGESGADAVRLRD